MPMLRREVLIGSIAAVALIAAEPSAAQGAECATIAARIRNIVAVQLGVTYNKVAADASFIDDLGADSLDFVELIMAFEDELKIAIPDEEALKINTVGKATAYVKTRLSCKG